ncbi:ATP-binding protein [Nocardioides sp. 616]|uniref:sensor histidine kinase n=1 Tax=Nocardioides sp. 616 TaxID=2268090 RepID=UPI000CE39444|nr:ATP-binding protein [Nocardioides sp. 616]
MGSRDLFLLSVAIYSGLPLLYSVRRTSFQFLLLYSHIASVLTFCGLLGAVYILPVGGGVNLLAGQVAFAGFLFGTFITVVVGRDLQVVRNVVALTIVVNVLVAAVFAVSGTALQTSGVVNPFDTSPVVFQQSLSTVLIGGALMVLELLVLLAVLEWAKKRLGPWPMALVYPTTYVGALALDGLLFPVLVLRPDSGLGDAIWQGVQAKLVLAAAFLVPLLLFVTLFRRTLNLYEARPLNLLHLTALSRDHLLEKLDSQQQQLLEQHDRIVDSTASYGRANATVERILDSATNTILIALDPNLRITHFNAGAQRLLGYTGAEVAGEPLSLFHSPSEIARHAAALGTDADHVQVLRVQMAIDARRDWEFVASRGTRHVVSLGITEVVVDSAVVGYVAAGEDVTTRLRAETAMMTALTREHDALVRLQEADRVKEELVSTVSHELRTPIASISGYTEMLADGAYGILSDEQTRALERVLRNTERLERLVDDLLVLERTEGAPLMLERVPLDFSDVIRGTGEMVTQMVRGRDLKFSVSLPAQPVCVNGDHAALERMVLNLISNAVKFTPGRGTIAVRISTDDTHAWLTVADTGIGVAEEDVDKLFTRFFRTREANDRAIPGSGLGLSIVQAVVSSHDGEVSISSSTEVGTTVRVSLPLVVA